MASPPPIARSDGCITPAANKKGADTLPGGPTPCRARRLMASPEFDSPVDPFVARRVLQHTPPQATCNLRTTLELGTETHNIASRTALELECLFIDAGVQTGSLDEGLPSECFSEDDAAGMEDWWNVSLDCDDDVHQTGNSLRRSCSRRARGFVIKVTWWLIQAIVMKAMMTTWSVNIEVLRPGTTVESGATHKQQHFATAADNWKVQSATECQAPDQDQANLVNAAAKARLDHLRSYIAAATTLGDLDDEVKSRQAEVNQLEQQLLSNNLRCECLPSKPVPTSSGESPASSQPGSGSTLSCILGGFATMAVAGGWWLM